MASALSALLNTTPSMPQAPTAAAASPATAPLNYSPAPSNAFFAKVAAAAPTTPAASTGSLAALARGGNPPAPATAPIVSPYTTPVTVQASPNAPASQTSTIPPQWINPAGGLYTPDQVAQNAIDSANAFSSNGDIPSIAGNALTSGPQSQEQLQATATNINNTRNDIATGTTDPYNVENQSGVDYSPDELSAIEKAYAGIYDPALNTAMAKLSASQTATAAQNTAAAQTAEQIAVEQAAPYTLGFGETRYGGTGGGSGSSSSSAGGSNGGPGTPGSDLTPYIKTTANGNQYADFSTVTNPDERSVLENEAQAAGLQPPTDDNIAKLNAIADTRANLGNIATQFQNGVGYQNGLTKTLGGFGLSNDIASLFGDSNISSFNAWRTAEINSIQALAGGSGSGVRINQAEINAAMQNDIPNKDETVAQGLAKIAVLNQQLNNWENQILNKPTGSGNTAAGTTQSSSSAGSFNAPDGIQWVQGPDGTWSPFSGGQTSFNSVGNTTASASSINKPQRNNNPGDIKAGGLADSLAIGADPDGTLIFPNAIAGTKALTLDLTAKVNGASKYLPPNPTIAQLASVYAQDPNYAEKLAKQLGVSVNTPTQSIPITRLARAIAVNEGYFS